MLKYIVYCLGVFLFYLNSHASLVAQTPTIAAVTGLNRNTSVTPETPPEELITYNLLRFSIKYRTTDFAYLTTTSYSDAATLFTGSNVIRVVTGGTPDANFLTSANYKYADDPDDDRIMFRDADGKIHVWENDFTEESQITAQVASTFEQGVCYDPVNERLYSYKSNGTVKVFDLTGTLIETLTAPVVSQAVHWYYDYANEKFYVSTQGTNTNIKIWVRSGGALVLSETLWFNSLGGSCVDNINNEVVCFDATRTSFRFRKQTLEGTDQITIYPRPFTSGFTGEGLTVAPDGTIYCAEPSGHDDGIVGGNRLWHFDPRGNYLKYDYAPSMTRFDRFTGGTVSGQFDTQIITQEVGEKIYSPIYDTQGFTNTENASAWSYEFSTGGDADITWVGSNTAPTTTSVTNYYSNLPQYNGWGATTPSSEQGTPGSYRYKQAVLLVKDETPSSEITIQDLINVIQPDILCIEDDSEKMYVYTDATLVNQVPILVNQANPSNNFKNTTVSTRWVKQTDYLDDQSTSAVITLTTPSGITSDQSGYLGVVTRREATNTLNTILAVGTQGSANNRILIKHNSTSGSPASSLVIEQTNSVGTVINRVSTTDTGLAYKFYEFIATGSAWEIWANQVNQSLTTTGAPGDWFGDLTTPNQVARGTATSNAGRGRYHAFLYKAGTMTTAMRTLWFDYLTQENLIDP